MIDKIIVVRAPSVHVVGRSSVDEDGLNAFLEAEGVEGWKTDAVEGGEKLVEVAGRLCYMSFARPRPGGNKAYIQHIMEVGHGSVLEHAVFQFIFSGISRTCAQQLLRHRVGLSPSMLSQRYVDSSEIAFVVPPLYLEGDDEAARSEVLDRWSESCVRSLESYKALIEWAKAMTHVMKIGDLTSRRKRIREAARSVLPECVETKIFATMNARAIRHFLHLRGSSGADAEIRRLAVAVYRKMVVEAPSIVQDFQLFHDTDGRFFLDTQYGSF